MIVTPLEIAVGNRILEAVIGATRFFVRRARYKQGAPISAAEGLGRESTDSVRAILKGSLASIPATYAPAVENYSRSAEFHSVIRQVLALRLLYGPEFRQAAEKALATLGAGLRLYLTSDRQPRVDIGRLLLANITDSVDVIVNANQGRFRTYLESATFRHFLEAQESLIPRTIESLIYTGAPQESISWIDRYHVTASARYSKVKAPHWDAQVIVPLDQVYVPARLRILEDLSKNDIRLLELVSWHERQVRSQAGVHFAAADEAGLHSKIVRDLQARQKTLQVIDPRELSYKQMAVDRTVVLGDPGAGKTTLATRIASDVLAGRPLFNNSEAKPTVPLVVVMRRYAAGGIDVSFRDYLETTLRTDFQLPPPDGLIEFLLLTGRAMVVFDGLDELLDTSLRRHAAEAIEAFSTAYPNAPMLVTSRLVGYDRAPLDPSVFTVHRIEPFEDQDIRKYAESWFVHNDAESSFAERFSRAESFLQTTSSIRDLCANPLLLALLCNLYKATGYQDLPRSRPAVLERCALVLFDRWDRHRSIGNVDFEQDFEPAVAWIAHEMFLSGSFADGIEESKLIDLTTDFFWPRLFETEGRARAFARSLVEHCKDRAWVFTDVGTTADGESIYAFSHRTFLEYFAALYLVRTHRTPLPTLQVLLPHVEQSDWGLVPLLAVQILSKRFDGAADEVVNELLNAAEANPTSEAGATILVFTLDLLGHIPLGAAAIRRLTVAATNAAAGRGAHGRSRLALPKVEQVLPENRESFIATNTTL